MARPSPKSKKASTTADASNFNIFSHSSQPQTRPIRGKWGSTTEGGFRSEKDPHFPLVLKPETQREPPRKFSASDFCPAGAEPAKIKFENPRAFSSGGKPPFGASTLPKSYSPDLQRLKKFSPLTREQLHMNTQPIM